MQAPNIKSDILHRHRLNSVLWLCSMLLNAPSVRVDVYMNV